MSLISKLKILTIISTTTLISLPLQSYSYPLLKPKPIFSITSKEQEYMKRESHDLKNKRLLEEKIQEQRGDVIFTLEEYKKAKDNPSSKDEFLIRLKTYRILNYPNQVYEILTEHEKQDFESYRGMLNFGLLTEREIEMYNLKKSNYQNNKLGHDLIIWLTLKHDEELAKEK